MRYILDADALIHLVRSGILENISNSKQKLSVLNTTYDDQITGNKNTENFDFLHYVDTINLTSEQLKEVEELMSEKNIGFHDWTLIVAGLHYNHKLITTNDKTLYKTAIQKGVSVIRLIGLLRQLFNEECINGTALITGLNRLKESNSVRVPNSIIDELIEEVTKKDQ